MVGSGRGVCGKFFDLSARGGKADQVKICAPDQRVARGTGIWGKLTFSGIFKDKMINRVPSPWIGSLGGNFYRSEWLECPIGLLFGGGRDDWSRNETKKNENSPHRLSGLAKVTRYFGRLWSSQVNTINASGLQERESIPFLLRSSLSWLWMRRIRGSVRGPTPAAKAHRAARILFVASGLDLDR